MISGSTQLMASVTVHFGCISPVSWFVCSRQEVEWSGGLARWTLSPGPQHLVTAGTSFQLISRRILLSFIYNLSGRESIFFFF